MTGRRLSQVQQFGLEMLMILDEFARGQEQDERMRLALLTANPALARGLYPGYFDSEDTAEEEVQEDDGSTDLHQEGVAYDFSQVEWQSPTELPDDEFEAMKELLGRSGITVGTPAEAPEGVEDETGFREPSEPDWM